MNSSASIVLSRRQARAVRVRRRLSARSKRPLLAITTRSVMSRSTGLAALRNEPHAQLPAAPSPLRQMTSPRSSRPRSSCRMRMTSAERLRYGLRPEVRDVHRDAPARFELARAFGEHVAQQVEVLEVRRRDALAFELLFVLLAREVRRRRDDQRDRPVVRSRPCAARRLRRTARRVSYGATTSSSPESSGASKRS